jgi:hypothetical protein
MHFFATGSSVLFGEVWPPCFSGTTVATYITSGGRRRKKEKTNKVCLLYKSRNLFFNCKRIMLQEIERIYNFSKTIVRDNSIITSNI